MASSGPPNTLTPAVYECSCSVSGDMEDCRFEGECREPLAWCLGEPGTLVQSQCPFFTVLPSELRTLIWEFALTECTSFQRDHVCADQSIPDGRPDSSKIGFNLLRTCRAIYLETYTLPLSLNPYHVYFGVRRNLHEKSLLPWQLAQIQNLKFSVRQCDIEAGNGSFGVIVAGVSRWSPRTRHRGVYIGPHWYKDPRSHRILPFAGPSVSSNGLEGRQLLADVLSNTTDPLPELPPIPPALRVVRARPFTRLTLVLSPTDWWTWEELPANLSPLSQLALDPAVGNGGSHHDERPTVDIMRQLASERLAGSFTDSQPLNETDRRDHSRGWGRHVANFPDLMSLELILETFAPKVAQLENVVNCAKSWEFPIFDTKRKLVWDGKVETGRYVHEPEEWNQVRNPRRHRPRLPRPWYADCHDVEVRIITFTKEKNK